MGALLEIWRYSDAVAAAKNRNLRAKFWRALLLSYRAPWLCAFVAPVPVADCSDWR